MPKIHLKREKVWCEHIVWHLGNWAILFEGSKVFTMLKDWNICPIKNCGKPRPEPEEPKTFYNLILEIFAKHNNQYSSSREWREALTNDLASAAERWFREKR